jgi:hypothetical protein
MALVVGALAAVTVSALVALVVAASRRRQSSDASERAALISHSV